jgi:alpha-ketoglutarate-dependent taurine dioxygenase
MQKRLTKLINTHAQNIVNTPRVDCSLLSNEANFPLVISPRSSGLILTEWIKENRDMVTHRLNEHGAILFRGFQVDTVDKFKDFVNIFDPNPLEYKQRSSPRFEVAKNIYHSTTYPADQSINMHSENSYALQRTRKIVFCCIQPAGEQGETPIADNRLVVSYISEATKKKFMEKGVRYVRNISKGIGLSWNEVFQTWDKDAVAEECRRNGMEFKWDGDDRLVLSWNNKAIYDHPETNEQIWFNHAFFFNRYALPEEVLSSFESDEDLPFNTYFGDGGQIAKEEIEEIRMAYEKASVKFPWAKGDVLFLDNMLMSHGRSPFKGNRQIIVSMF